jgi:hypothetical protein
VGSGQTVSLAGLESVRCWLQCSVKIPYLLTATGPACLDAVAALDNIGLERDGAGSAVELQEQAAGVAQDRAGLIAAPEGRGAGAAILADRLRDG